MIKRFQAIQRILSLVDDTDLVLSTTGMISREVYAFRERPTNFYMIGSMGLLGAFGLGLARLAPNKRVFVLDGDGSALMSLGTSALIAYESPDNLIHVILDNEAYESTGAQPSISSNVDLSKIGTACGYRTSLRIETNVELDNAMAKCAETPGPHLLLIKVGISPVEGIGRVSHTPIELRDRFLRAF